MTDQIPNRSKGRVTEWVERVNANDPANAVFVVDLLATTGLEADATLRDKDSFTDYVSGATNFATGTGWARKVLDQAGGLTVTYDDTNDRVDVDMPDQTWTAVADAADDVSRLLTGYDSDSTGGTDANILPATQHDFVIQPDGSDVTAQIAATGFYRAS
jgi:hypothetical protein